MIIPDALEIITQLTSCKKFKSLIEDAIACDPRLQNDRFFSLQHLANVLNHQNDHANVLEFENLCIILRTSNQLNASSAEKHFNGSTALALLTRYPVGILKLQKDEVLCRNINSQGLNEKDQLTGESAVFFLASSPAGRVLLLNNPNLRALIDINTLMHVISAGVNRDKSTYKCLSKTRQGKEILNSPELRARIAEWKRLTQKSSRWVERLGFSKKTVSPSLANPSPPLGSAPPSRSSPAVAGIFAQAPPPPLQPYQQQEQKNENKGSCVLM